MDDNFYISMLQGGSGGDYERAVRYFWDEYFDKVALSNANRRGCVLDAYDRKAVAMVAFQAVITQFSNPGKSGSFPAYLKTAVIRDCDKATKKNLQNGFTRLEYDEDGNYTLDIFSDDTDLIIYSLDAGRDGSLWEFFSFELHCDESAFFMGNNKSAQKYGRIAHELSSSGQKCEPRFVAERLGIEAVEAYLIKDRLMSIKNRICNLYDNRLRLTGIDKPIVNLRLQQKTYEKIADILREERSVHHSVEAIKKIILFVSRQKY